MLHLLRSRTTRVWDSPLPIFSSVRLPRYSIILPQSCSQVVGAVMADTRLPSFFQMSASLFTTIGVSLSEQRDSNRSGCDPRFPNLLVQHSLSHQCRPHWPGAGLQGGAATAFLRAQAESLSFHLQSHWSSHREHGVAFDSVTALPAWI